MPPITSSDSHLARSSDSPTRLRSPEPLTTSELDSVRTRRRRSARSKTERSLEPIMACFERWGTRHAGLFTFPHSQKHVGLYQRFGFWPRFLTAIMSKPVAKPEHRCESWTTLTVVPRSERDQRIADCRALTDVV